MCAVYSHSPKSVPLWPHLYLQLSTRIVGRGWQSPAIERDTVFIFFHGFLSVSRSTRCREYSYLVTRFSDVAYYAYFECPLTPVSSFFLLSHLRLTRSILPYTKRYDRDLWQQNVQWSTTKNMPLYTIDCIVCYA